jgi:8-oxo-dGTP diphosphatase
VPLAAAREASSLVSLIVTRIAKTCCGALSAGGPERTIVLRIRVAALVIGDDGVLLARHVKDGRTAFLLPGGGAEPGEAARDALARELREEAELSASIGALRYVIEARSPEGRRHIVQLVFEATALSAVGASSDVRVAGCEWHPVNELRRLPIHPDAGAVIADDLESASRPQCRYVIARWRD